MKLSSIEQFYSDIFIRERIEFYNNKAALITKERYYPPLLATALAQKHNLQHLLEDSFLFEEESSFYTKLNYLLRP